MTSKSMKPTAPQAPKPLTEEEKLEHVARFFAQKREAFATGILFNLCQSVGAAQTIIREDHDGSTYISLDTHGLVKDAVAMADELIKELYPIDKPAE